MFRTIHPAVWIVPSAMLLIAAAPMPYGYYMLLRLVVCAAAAFLAYQHYQALGALHGWAVTLGLVALVFNPLLPLHLDREL